MLTLLSALSSLLSFRVRSRLTLELELVALRHRYQRRAACTVCGDRTCTAVPSPGVVAVRNCVARGLTRSEPTHGDRVAALMAGIRLPQPSPAARPVDPQRPTARTRPQVTTTSSCEAEHWVETVTDDGHIVKLEDGSIWEIDLADRVTVSLWLPTTDIVMCSDKLINTEDGETAQATRLQ